MATSSPRNYSTGLDPIHHPHAPAPSLRARCSVSAHAKEDNQGLRQSTKRWHFISPSSHATTSPREAPPPPPEALRHGDAARGRRPSNVAPDPSMEPPLPTAPRRGTMPTTPLALGGSHPRLRRAQSAKGASTFTCCSIGPRERENNCLLLDDDAVLADAAHPIASLPFLSTRDTGEPVASYGNAEEPPSPASPTRSGTSSPVLKRDARQPMSVATLPSPTNAKRRDLRRIDVSPTRRTAKVIFLDETVGGLVYDDVGIFVARFDLEDFVLHSTTGLNIGDVVTYNRVREGGPDAFRAVRLVRQRMPEEEDGASRLGLLGSVAGDGNGLADFSCLPFDTSDSGRVLAIEGRRHDRKHNRLRASLVGLEYRTFLARGSRDLTASNCDNAHVGAMDESSMASLRRVLNPLTSLQHKGLGKRLMQMSREHPEWLLQQVEQEFDADALAALASSGHQHAKNRADPLSIFQLHDTRATLGAVTEFLTRDQAHEEELEKRRHAQKQFHWWMPRPQPLEQEHMEDAAEGIAAPQREDTDTVSSDDVPDQQPSSGSGHRRVLVGQMYDQERRRIATVNVRTFVDGVDLEAPSPTAHPSWARRQPKKPPQGDGGLTSQQCQQSGNAVSTTGGPLVGSDTQRQPHNAATTHRRVWR